MWSGSSSPRETFALLRQARSVLDDEHGTHLPDDAFVAALSGAVLDGAPRGEPTGRAKFQIAVTVCQRCRQGWQEGAGAQVAIDGAAVDRALCDAQHIGSIDGDGPERAHQDIPPSVARFVWRRDGGRCRVNGCRSSRGLELHHLIHRADGGGHDASNIVLICSSCHLAHHRGALTISGTAGDLQVRRPGETAANGGQEEAIEIGHAQARGAHVSVGARTQPAAAADAQQAAGGTLTADPDAHMGAMSPAVMPAGGELTPDPSANVGAMSPAVPVDDASQRARASSKRDAATVRAHAKAALTGLGWKPAIAHAAVAAAAEAHGAEMTLERLIFEALRRCPAPRA